MLLAEGKNGTTGGNILHVDTALPKTNGTNRKSMAASVLRKNLKELPPQLTRFQVTLEEPHKIFFAGDELKGNVEIDLAENLPIQGIILKIVGEAYVNVSDEPRPWTSKRVSNIKSTFKSSKISPSSISERIDLAGKFNDFPVPFYMDPSTKWETATMTTVTGSRSQRSTLQRDQNPAVITKKSSIRRQEEVNRRFRSHEKYFEHKAYVFGHKYSSTREMMWTGKHSFPFTYTLPSKLPASFHGRYGYVRYYCEASLERHNLPTIQRRTFFSVNTIMDLNTDSKADSGVSKGKKTNSWCFCCASGTVIVSTKVKRRGFVPGETIPVQAHILNVSNKTISKISAKIIQIATYYSSKAFRNHPDEAIVSERVRGAIPPGESSAWDDEGPKVPPVPPSSTMIDCKLITLDYRLDFVLDIIGAKESLVIRMPLRIGSVPLEKTFNNFSESPDESSFWSPYQTSLPQNIQTKYSNIPVPYSMKCVKGDRNVNRYYFRQIPRAVHNPTGINLRMPNAPPQPIITDEQEVYAPRYLTYREIDVKRQEAKSTEKPTKEKTTIGTTLNGGMLSESSLQRHLVICVSPQASTRRITPSSATRLIDATPDSSSIWNSPISVKSVKSITSKKSLPAMKFDLINFISESNSIRAAGCKMNTFPAAHICEEIAVANPFNVRNYFVASGMKTVGVSAAGGVGRATADWIVNGYTSHDLYELDISRFLGLHNNSRFLRDRVKETPGMHHGLIYPFHEYKTGRNLRMSPIYPKLREAGAVFGQVMGYERPTHFDPFSDDERLPDGSKPYRIAVTGTFGKPDWFDMVADEYSACRERIGLSDYSSFTKIELWSKGREVVDLLQYLCSNDMDAPIGTIIHTGMQNVNGGYENDCSLIRMAENHFFMIAPTIQQTRCKVWINRFLPKDGSVHMSDVTSMYTAICIMGPFTRNLLGELTDTDLSSKNFPFFTFKEIDIGSANAIRALNITHTGELGFVLYIPNEFALHVYQHLIDAGQKYGIQHAGYFAMRSLRLEKFFAFWGQDLDTSTTPLECGRTWRVKFDKGVDFIGRDALLKQREAGVKRMYVQLILMDHDTEKDLWPWGGEPIYRNGKYVGATTTTGYGHTFKKQICLGFVKNLDENGDSHKVTSEWVLSGNYEVDIAGIRYPAKVNLHSPNLPTKFPDKERAAYRATRDKMANEPILSSVVEYV